MYLLCRSKKVYSTKRTPNNSKQQSDKIIKESYTGPPKYNGNIHSTYYFNIFINKLYYIFSL